MPSRPKSLSCLLAAAFLLSTAAVAAPPANDDCTGAIVIPAGAFPYVTDPVDVTEATPAGSNDPNLCSSIGVDRDIWFSFTPALSGRYVFSTCTGDGATGNTAYDTVIGILDACTLGNSLGCNDTAASCPAAVPGAPYVDQSVLAAVLTPGVTYYIGVGHWANDTDGIQPGFNQIAVKVDRQPGPDNDTCSNPKPLALDRITTGTTAAATNDYRSPASCFTGLGQLPSSSNGLDVVFSFTPPDNDKYSFRYVQDDSSSALHLQSSPVLYLADNCPAPDPTTPISGCIAAANRMNDQTTGNGNRGEEIPCVPLTGGTTYYLFFDDQFTNNSGGDFALEVTRCRQEIEPNDTVATATPYVPNSGCFMEGSSNPSGPSADYDFYDLGNAPAGAKIFAAIDAASSSTSDYTMRITTATGTLGFDDDDGTSNIGSNAPVVSGPISTGGEVYAEVNGKTVLASGQEPYRLFARIETAPVQSEDPELEPNGPTTLLNRYTKATKVTGGGHVGGVMATYTDEDCFQFLAHKGDNIVVFSDNNPNRVAGTTITNVWPVLQLIDNNAPPANARFLGQVVRNNMTASPGTLLGTTPSVTSEFAQYRARYDGAYTFCFTPTEDVTSQTNPSSTAYPLPWAGDITINCGPVPAPGPADLSIAKTGPAGPIRAGDIVSYTITITNNDPSNIAWSVHYVDHLPPELIFTNLTVNDGFGSGRNAFAASLPTPGTHDAPIDVINVSIAPGATVVYTLSVQVQNCLPAGTTVSNTATVSSYTLDANSANDSSSWSFQTTNDGSCTDILCDANGCSPDYCTVHDHCQSGTCVSTPVDCDDHNVCTADSCDPTNQVQPCIHDDSQLGAYCYDGNPCTFDECDPVQFCVFPPVPLGWPCNDFNSCTPDDHCDGYGVCISTVTCNDGQPCTDDFADESNNCACTHPISFMGTRCAPDSCHTDGMCDGTGGSADHCQGATPVNCDDANACTNDACDPVSGCVHTPRDSDGDGHGDASCGGDDCDDLDPATYPNAPETNDGKDNQCPGDSGYGVVDEISGIARFDTSTSFCWTAQAGASGYEVARSTNPEFSGCELLEPTSSLCSTDAASPIAGESRFYLVRSITPHKGSWGQDSTGMERTPSCP